MNIANLAQYFRIFTPFLKWLPELKNPATLRADLIGGLTVALVLIPQSMAYAQLAGLPAYYGLYASFLPPLVGAIFGSSRQLATGPVAVVSLLTAAALEPIAVSGGESYILYAIMLALMVGIFQLMLGVLRLGVLINFLSHPVVIGFTNAAAIIIATSQLSKIFGVSVEKAPYHYETVWNTLAAAWHDTYVTTLAIAILAFAIMITMKRISPRIPGVLIAVAITIVISIAIDFEKIRVVEPNEFAGKGARKVIAENLALNKDLTGLSERFTVLDKKYKKVAAEQHHRSNKQSTKQRRLLRRRDKAERKLKNTKSNLAAFKKIQFEYVVEGIDIKPGFYTRDAVPEGGVTDNNIWTVNDINKDGTLRMHAGGKVVGQIPEGLPSFKVPTTDLNIVLQLISSAIAIALIGFMEAISIAKAMAARTRQRLDANQELVGQGISNIVGSFFQSYPVSGSFSRSAVNISAGAKTGFSSVVTSIVVVITLLWLTPLLYHLPQATLAAVIMMAVVGLVNVKSIKHAWRVQKHDGLVALITFLLTLAFAPHLDRAIMIGVILSLMLYLYRTMKPRVAVIGRHPDGSLRDASIYGLETCPNISIIRFDGSLYFANTSYFEDEVLRRSAEKEELKYLIVDGQGINEVDATGEEMLLALTGRLRKVGLTVVFVRFKRQVMDAFRNSGFIECVGPEFFYRRTEFALDAIWKELGDNHEVDCSLNVVCAISSDPEKS
ncbi:MAG: hypothetical protein BMS9Abin36_0945 [Gammaproteobacteria bacterium]|nr:MAG: hypothetical protein BMS9Abin36_0945 [Gammaproteobacteria bacterium]